MNKYDEMSDYEINKMVFPHSRNYGKYSNALKRPNPQKKSFSWGDGANWFEFDPCNKPADMWPIINSAHMSIEMPHPDLCGIGTISIYNHRGADWELDFNQGENPLRAAAIVFLMMKDAE